MTPTPTPPPVPTATLFPHEKMTKMCYQECHAITGEWHPHPLTISVASGTWLVIALAVTAFVTVSEAWLAVRELKRADSQATEHEAEASVFFFDFHLGWSVAFGAVALFIVMAAFAPEMRPHRPYLFWSGFAFGWALFSIRRHRWLSGRRHPARKHTGGR